MSDTRVCSERQARRGRFSSGTSFGFEPSEQAPHDQRQHRRWDRPLEHQPGVGEAGAGEDGLWTGRSRHRPRYRVHLRRGETIHTENYRKYRLERIPALLAEAGFVLERQFFDRQRRFSLNLAYPRR